MTVDNLRLGTTGPRLVKYPILDEEIDYVTDSIFPYGNAYRYGAIDDWDPDTGTGTDNAVPLQNCMNALINMGWGRMSFQRRLTGKYYTSVGIVGNPTKIEIVGEGASGFGASIGSTGDSTAAIELVTDQAILMMDLGDNLHSRWNGPVIKNLGFRDVAGTALGGIRCTRLNHMNWENVSFADFAVGYAWEFDGGSDWVQYVTIVNPRVSGCKYAYKKTNKNSDITLFGGLLQCDLIAGSIGIWDSVAGAGGGRLNVFGTGFNWWDTGMEIDGWSSINIRATFEQQNSPSSSYHTGTAIKLRNTTGDFTKMLNQRLSGSNFDKYAVGIDVGANCQKTIITGNTFVDTPTPVSDFGVGTQIGFNAMPASYGQLARFSEIQASDGSTFAVELHGKTPATGTATQPYWLNPLNSGLHIVDDMSIDGGLFLSGDGDKSGAIGVGISGDLEAPRVISDSFSMLVYNNNGVTMYAGSGITPGTIITLSTHKLWTVSGTLFDLTPNGMTLKARALSILSTGTNARCGEATLGTGGTVTVATTAVTANSLLNHSRRASSGGSGTITYTRNPGVGFTIASSDPTDRSTIGWHLIEPG